MKAQPLTRGLAIETNFSEEPSVSAADVGWSPSAGEWNCDTNMMLSSRSTFSTASQKGLYTALSPMGFEWSPTAVAAAMGTASTSKKGDTQHFFPSTAEDSRFSIGSALAGGMDAQDAWDTLFQAQHGELSQLDDELSQASRKRKSNEFELRYAEFGENPNFKSPMGRTSPMFQMLIDRLSPRGSQGTFVCNTTGFPSSSPGATHSNVQQQSGVANGQSAQSVASNASLQSKTVIEPLPRKGRTPTNRRNSANNGRKKTRSDELSTEFNIQEQVAKLRVMRPEKRSWYVKILARKAKRLGLAHEFETELESQAHEQASTTQVEPIKVQSNAKLGSFKEKNTPPASKLDDLCMTPPPRSRKSSGVKRTESPEFFVSSTSSPPAPAAKRISLSNDQVNNTLEEVNLASSEFLRKSLQYRFQGSSARSPPVFRSPEKPKGRNWIAPVDKRAIVS